MFTRVFYDGWHPFDSRFVTDVHYRGLFMIVCDKLNATLLICARRHTQRIDLLCAAAGRLLSVIVPRAAVLLLL